MTRRQTLAAPAPNRIPTPRHCTLASAVLLSTMMLGACDGGTDTLSGSIDLLRTKIEAMNSTGLGSATAEQRQKVYNNTIASVRDLMDDATESQKASLSLIQAQANSGLADIEADSVHGIAAEVTAAISEVRSGIDLYLSQYALADSMLGYSPAEDLSQLDAQTAVIEQRMASTRQALAENDQKLAAMIAEAAELEAQATSELDQAAKLNVEAMSLTGQQRSAMIQQETEHRLRAAEFQRLQSMKQVEIDRIQPVSAEAQDEIVRLQRQLDRLAQARATVREMDRSLTRESEAARKEGVAVANELAQRAEKLRTLVEEKFLPAYESAMGKYSTAASDVGRARGAGDRAAVAQLAGSIASSAAMLAQSQADITANLAGVMGELAEVKPSLAGREKFAQRQSEYAGMSQEARSAYRGFAQTAASSFRSSGAKGEAGTVLSGVADWYDARSGGGNDGEEAPIEEPGADPAVAEDAPGQG